MNPQMQSAAMQGALTGERPTRTVTFPTTGDPETDLISGILSLATDLSPMVLNKPEAISRVLRYLADRYEAIASSGGLLGGLGNPPQVTQTQLTDQQRLEQERALMQAFGLNKP